ncbi:MAG: hypothetical protein BWX80_03555 [Candidatus Hydrogenedentes bacterium ADurb.Bin101]|nr:MAG: hypothetical protein BWX80_03555 [Candidatus Hydrogenedentes bacterium ADurb.Bin101]
MFHSIIKGGTQEAGTRRRERHQVMQVHRDLVFPSSKKTPPRMEPFRKIPRDMFYPFGELTLSPIPRRDTAANAAAAGNGHGNPFIHRGAHQGGFAVSGMPGQDVFADISLGKGGQVIQAASRRPAAPHQARPVILGPGLAKRIRVVAGVSPGVHASDVATAQRDLRPSAMIVLGHENGKRAGTFRDIELDPQVRLMIRSKTQFHLPYPRARDGIFLDCFCGKVGRRRRNGTQNPMLQFAEQAFPLLAPAGDVCYGRRDAIYHRG